MSPFTPICRLEGFFGSWQVPFNGMTEASSPHKWRYNSLFVVFLILVLAITIGLSAGMGYTKIHWMDVLKVVCGQADRRRGLDRRPR